MLPRIPQALTAATLASCVLASSLGTGSPSPYTGRKPIPRPDVRPWPHTTGRAQPPSPPRDRQCFVKAAGKGEDDAPAILRAFHDCNQGGTVVLDGDYTIATALDLRFLDAVDVALSGSVSFRDDIDYWVEHSFKVAYQNSSAFWLWGGRDVNLYGGGVGKLDGRGQAWWDGFAVNGTLMRPILFVTDGLQGGTFSGINMVNSPNVSAAAPRRPHSLRRAKRGLRAGKGSLTQPPPPLAPHT